MLWQPRPLKYSCAAGIQISSSCDPSFRAVKHQRGRGGHVFSNVRSFFTVHLREESLIFFFYLFKAYAETCVQLLQTEKHQLIKQHITRVRFKKMKENRIKFDTQIKQNELHLAWICGYTPAAHSNPCYFIDLDSAAPACLDRWTDSYLTQ